MVRVAAANRDELRLIRTELELLRRIRRARGKVKARTFRREKGWVQAGSAWSRADRAELRRIAADAARPIVDEMIAVMDAE
ncbi:MAG: hypothetical protein D6788_02945, partial [Planctomycetota bacterium]